MCVIIFRTLEDELVRSSSSSSLVDMFNKASDEMNRTMLRQVSQAKIKEKQSTETGDKEQKQGLLSVDWERCSVGKRKI